MGRQVNFFLLPDDFADIQRAFEAAGPVVFFRDRSETRDLQPVVDLVIAPAQMGRTSLRVYATRPQDLPDVKVKWYEQPRQWIVDEMDSPVLEVDRCFYDGNLIRDGRVYFATDLRFRRHLLDEGFMRWGSSVLGRIRRRLVLDRDIHRFCYVSERVRSWLRNRDATIRGNSLISGIPDGSDPYASEYATR